MVKKNESGTTPTSMVVNNSAPVSAPMPAQSGMANIFSDMATFNAAWSMATALAQSTIVPKDYQDKPSNCLIAIEMAVRLNTSPMMVMQHLFVVNGRPAWSSQWIISMINNSRRYITELQYEFGNATEDGGLSCFAWAKDRNGHKVVGPKITMMMAEKEGWIGKNGSKWKTMPEVMIRYRAASFFGRLHCPDMIMGIYSREEVLDMDLEELPPDPVTGEAENDTPVSHSKEDLEPITQDQRQSLFNLARQHFGKEGDGVLREILSDRGIESTHNMPLWVFRNVLDDLMKRVSKKNNGEENEDLTPSSDSNENA